ncbi:unnamed protein product [Orchesella dallaii]|uniref:EGF-like domain-containing protein n=1 Tax=Orchesella dallaii TaxID=48710 RepID=A0ABP1S4S7_9HEXA
MYRLQNIFAILNFLIIFHTISGAEEHCDSMTEIYDPDQLKCVLKVGSSCLSQEEKCAPGSHCVVAIDGIKRCSCFGAKSKSENGTCLLSNNEFCGSSLLKQCDFEQGLVCKQGYCSCKYGQFQRFNITLEKCVSTVPGPCNNFTKCVENAHCSENLETFQQCVCSQGFIAVGGHCQLDYGEKCEYIHNYRGSHYNFNSFTCDTAAPLKCIDGICQCENLEEYDTNMKICRGLVGTVCSLKNEEYCTENGECGMRRDRHLFPRRGQLDGFCKCKTGSSANSKKRCVR